MTSILEGQPSKSFGDKRIQQTRPKFQSKQPGRLASTPGSKGKSSSKPGFLSPMPDSGGVFAQIPSKMSQFWDNTSNKNVFHVVIGEEFF